MIERQISVYQPQLKRILFKDLFKGLPWWLRGQNVCLQQGKPESGSGRSLGERNDNPLQYSCLEKPNGAKNLAGLEINPNRFSLEFP